MVTVTVIDCEGPENVSEFCEKVRKLRAVLVKTPAGEAVTTILDVSETVAGPVSVSGEVIVRG